MTCILRLPPADPIHRRARQRGFERDDGLRMGGRVRRVFLRQPEHFLDVRGVLGADIARPVVVLYIKVAIRQPQTALIHIGNLSGRFVCVTLRSEPKQHRHAEFVEVRDHHRQVVGVSRRIEHHQVRRHRRESLALDRRFVHARRIKVRSLPRVSAAVR